MTRVITVRNVNNAIHEGFWWLKTAGIVEGSRNGPVIVAPGPVVTEYTHPRERVLFNPERDANAVFHLLESLWMLAGRDNVAWLLPYNMRMAQYAESDGTVHGAYGYRWMRKFGVDQVKLIIEELKAKPSSRQCVLQMWSAHADLWVDVKDRPCNTHVYFRVRQIEEHNVLDMTVCCRSNDALWGAYGANAVHFSILQELMALSIGIKVGTYHQFSNNFHAYTEVPTVKKWLDLPPENYERVYPEIIPLLTTTESYEDFISDCQTLTNNFASSLYFTKFFRTVVVPLKTAYDHRKLGSRMWRQDLQNVAECDWKQAFIEWTSRREILKGYENVSE